ncbi:cysteine proteinase [Peniophora sp. CONT]|nr:cysteine proteinase [Peniophora sp. CONT]
MPCAHSLYPSILVYTSSEGRRVDITNANLARLAPGDYLNDSLIDFGLNHWMDGLRTQQPDLAKNIHVFSSFFYTRLCKLDATEPVNCGRGYQAVKNWTSNIDIFNKRYLVVPLHKSLHWYLAIVYEPARILHQAAAGSSLKPPTYIFTFDSLGRPHPEAGETLGLYLRSEAEDKKRVVAPLSRSICQFAEVPTQPNSCDCGLYVLHFARRFMMNPNDIVNYITVRTPQGNDNDCRLVLNQYWDPLAIQDARGELKNLVLEESAIWKSKQRPGRERTAREHREEGVGRSAGDCRATAINIDSDSDL